MFYILCKNVFYNYDSNNELKNSLQSWINHDYL